MGLSSAAETAEVAAWAKQYPEVAAEIEVIQSGLESYAQTHAVAPAASGITRHRKHTPARCESVSGNANR